jgi:hypothetical protein
MCRELRLRSRRQWQLRSAPRELFCKRSAGQHRLYYSHDVRLGAVNGSKVSHDMDSRHSVATPR